MQVEVRTAHLLEAEDRALAQMADRLHTVIWSLSAIGVVRLSEEERREYLREAEAIANALEREQMRRLLERMTSALSQKTTVPRNVEKQHNENDEQGV
jgi:hypothetical protein